MLVNFKNHSIFKLVITTVVLLQFAITQSAESSFPIKELTDAEQTEIVQKYCVICHLDDTNNGDLSLEHFDAATVSPQLAAVLANKFTSGVPLEELLQTEFDAQLVEKIEIGKKYGAPSVMDAVGLPLPSEAEINGFFLAMARKAIDAELWHVSHEENRIIAETTKTTLLPETEFVLLRDQIYRLILTCDSESGVGEILLTWNPFPANGELEIIVDEHPAMVFDIDHKETIANGDPGTSQPSSVVLAGAAKRTEHPDIPRIRVRLRVQGPLETGQVEFSLDDLWEIEPQLSGTCF